MTTGATVARPDCDLSLTDGSTTVKLFLCKANGQTDPNQMRQAGFPRQALRFNPSGTGSASEMMAAALKEQKSAKIIGSKSAGAVPKLMVVPAFVRAPARVPPVLFARRRAMRLLSQSGGRT